MIEFKLTLINRSSHLLSLREQCDGAYFNPGPWAKVCPLCLSLWAVLERVPSKGEPWYSIHAVPCQPCVPGPPWWLNNNIPGSLIYDGSSQQTDWDLLQDLPPELVTREFKLHFSRINDMLTPEEQSKLELYRFKINAGEMLPIEETREAVRLLRNDRQNAAARAQASKAKGGSKAPKAPPRPASAILGQLGIPGLGQ